jgi:hypothetical protein
LKTTQRFMTNSPSSGCQTPAAENARVTISWASA